MMRYHRSYRRPHKSRFVEMFGDNCNETVKVDSLCELITKGTTPKSSDIIETSFNGAIPYLKVYNLSFDGRLLFDEHPQYISHEIHNGLLSRSRVLPNDVLMNIVGPPLGKFAMVTDEFPEWNVNQAIAIFRSKGRVSPAYLLHALQSQAVIRRLLKSAVGVRQLNISLEQCRNIEIPLPPLALQREFAAFVAKVDKLAFAARRRRDVARQMYRAKIQEFFG